MITDEPNISVVNEAVASCERQMHEWFRRADRLFMWKVAAVFGVLFGCLLLMAMGAKF